MLDLSEFEGDVQTGGWPCWWEARAFTPEQRAKLTEALFHRVGIQSSAIARVIQGWGFRDVSEGMVGKHRRRNCACGKRGKL
jgi:hypothetical protein